jgi:hypothetical protein
MTLIMKSPTALKSPKYPVVPAVESLPVAGYANRWNAEPLTLGAPVASLPNAVAGPWGAFIQTDPALQPSVVTEGGFKHVANTATSQLVMPPFTTTGAKTVVLVAKILGGNTAFFGANGANWNIGVSTTKFYMNAGTTILGPALDSAWHVFIAVFDGASSVFSVDGVEYAGNAGTNQPTNLRMFSIGGTAYATGGVRDVAIYPSALNPADRQTLTAALKKKYNL